MRGSLRALAVISGNIVMLLLASIVAMRIVYPATYLAPPSVWEPFGGEYSRFAVGHIVSYSVAGLVLSRWSPGVTQLVVPAIIVVFGVLTTLAMAMYGADGGDPREMMTFVFRDVGSLAVVLTAATAVGAGWFVGRRWFHKRRQGDNPVASTVRQ